jgi:hypothetical protein
MPRKELLTAPLLFLSLLLPLGLKAQINEKLVEARLTLSAPIIDGIVDSSEWASAAVITDFHQILPAEYAEPSEFTDVRIMYDSDAIYIAAIMYDKDPSSINNQVLRQGEAIWSDDFFSVIIDPFNDRRSGYRFITNPNGLRMEASYEDTSRQQWNWMGIWQTASTIDNEGWKTEIRIPFKSVPFDVNSNEWGINFRRTVGRNNEDIGWTSRNQTQNPSVVGRLVRLNNLNPGMGIEVIPSAILVNDRDLILDSTSSEITPSIDISYRITPSLNASLTLNTDFSATEVDDRQVDLSRFNLFFPEKRGFFLKDSDVFEFGRLAGGAFGGSNISRPSIENGRPFFSRSMGLSADNSPADINHGTKISGRIGDLNIGALVINQTDNSNQLTQNLVVTRLAYNILNESSLGFIATQGNPGSELKNSLLGLDFRYLNTRTSSGKPISGEVWYQESDTQGINSGQAAYGMRLTSLSNSGLRGGFGSKILEENFNPALGYTNRTGIQDTTLETGYTWRFSNPIIRSYFAGVSAQEIYYLDGPLQSKVQTLIPLDIENNQRDRLTISLVKRSENLITPFIISNNIALSEDIYNFDEIGFKVVTGPQRLISTAIDYKKGSFYSGDRTRLETSFLWTPSRHFRALVGYTNDDVTLPEGSFQVRLAKFKADIIFSSTLSWTNLIQYDNVSESAGINSRLHWIPEAGREVFLVINHSLEDYDLDNRFHTEDSIASIKASYNFRF